MSTPLARVACSGNLVSRSIIESVARENAGAVDASVAVAFRALLRHVPASRSAHARELVDAFASPCARLLGYERRGTRVAVDGLFAEPLTTARGTTVALVTLPAAEALRGARTPAITMAARLGVRWCMLVNGIELALVDCSRFHARQWLAFDLEACARDLLSLQALVAVTAARSLDQADGQPSALDLLIARSEADLRVVREALQRGVEEAALELTQGLDRVRTPHKPSREQLFEQALTVVYRILFLQFAESRGLVPVWHPTYRRGYTIEALRDVVDRGPDPTGVWDTLQAIARLAHKGAAAGELLVVPFNGRLFSPSHSPVVARAAIPDSAAAHIIAALTSRAERNGRRVPIAYSDLGVEQLGSIYERVLELSPEPGSRPIGSLVRRGDRRKATGSFYTPRTLTEFIVRKTLEPLTQDATPEQVLSLKVLDPAMGSGAFLVAACRELAQAYEEALARAGVAGAGDWSPADRAGFRRLVAQRCLYGVDLNPMAVQLGRLSLWLCSLAADKPLTFLDHRLRTGNSVLGASPESVMSRAPGPGRTGTPTLFGDDVMEVVGRASELRQAIAAIPDDSVAQVHQKEALLADLDSPGGPLARWRQICDLWCAFWFWPDVSDRPHAREFGAMCDALGGDRSLAPRALLARLDLAAHIAEGRRFFHWPLEFPEVLAKGGFDAVLGNPPWDMVRGDRESRQSLRFTRDSGTFRLHSGGHGNLYQLFLERILQLARQAGRVGVVVPWGLATDYGSAGLRRHLLERCTVDELVVLDNRQAIFPIHRALKFCALFLENGGTSDAFRYRRAVSDPEALNRSDEREGSPRPLELSRDLLEAISGPSLALPYVETGAELRVLERLVAAARAASDPSGWGLHFGRELNASDDKVLFSETPRGFPVISGRHIEAFKVNAHESALRIAPADAIERLGTAVNHHRLAYRDVAGASNRVTLIAAVIPPHVVTTHTLFCLKSRLSLDEQIFLCAILNSYVANYLVRTRVGTHVTTALVHALPVPKPRRDSSTFSEIVEMAKAGASPELQAAVAALYRLDRAMFETILATFPLVPAHEREAAAAALSAVSAI